LEGERKIWRNDVVKKDMRTQRLSIPVDFNLSFLKIRWSDRLLVKDGNRVVGEGVVYGGDWEKAERLARQMAEMKFGADRGNLRVCEQIFINHKSYIRNHIQGIIDRGSNLKLKVGRNVFEDIKIIEFIRRELKFEKEIRIDANQGYSLRQLRYIIPTLKECGIKYVEEPVRAEDLPAAAELLHRYGMKVILDENLNLLRSDLGIRQGRTFLDCIDAINIKLSRIGDINQALHLIKVAKKYHIKVIIGCSEELERGMETIYALGHEAKNAGVLLEVEGFGPLRLKRKDQILSLPRLINRLENVYLIIFHRFRARLFDLWWALARIPVLFLKESKKLSSLSLRLVELTRKYPGRMHPKHLIMADRQPEHLKWVKPGDEVLDIGCGNGQHSLRVASVVKAVTGFDIDENQLRLAKEAAVRLGVKNVKFENRSATEKFPYKSGRFDCVLFLGVLEHLVERDKVLEEVGRVLKPGGRLILGVPNEMTSWKKAQMRFGISHYTDPDHKIEFTKESIKQLLENHKFKVTKLNLTAYDTPWAGFIDLIGGISLKWYRKLLEWKWGMVNRYPEETISYLILAIKVK
jgi:ubiquinone/menaquinone biosynthesis C-methylase UbiE